MSQVAEMSLIAVKLKGRGSYMRWHSVIMVSLVQATLFLYLVAATAVSADVDVDCGGDSVRVTWREERSRVDPALLLLGDCPPTSVSRGEAVFEVELSTCSFRKMVTGDQLLYLNELIYQSAPNSPFLAFTKPVVCAQARPEGWIPDLFEPDFHSYGQADLVFNMELMNGDFTAPARSRVFPLGSLISIKASVEQGSHLPLLLLLEECVAATTPETRPGDQIYPIISNMGCLVDSKTTMSRFRPREETSEIRLSLQAFTFAPREEVYIHCKLVAWDPEGLKGTKKACHFVKGQGWELLDNPSYSTLCNCCDSSCLPRHKRERRALPSGQRRVAQNVVLGPLTITENSDP